MPVGHNKDIEDAEKVYDDLGCETHPVTEIYDEAAKDMVPIEDIDIPEIGTVITASTPQYPCPDNYPPEKWLNKSDDHKRAYLNTINRNKGGSQ